MEDNLCCSCSKRILNLSNCLSLGTYPLRPGSIDTGNNLEVVVGVTGRSFEVSALADVLQGTAAGGEGGMLSLGENQGSGMRLVSV